MSKSEPNHFISHGAKAQGRNVFVWCGNTGKISLSWRADLKVTETKMYHWIDTVIKGDSSGTMDEESLQYFIFPITVKPARGSILAYEIHPKISAPLSRNSENEVKAGDYGIYNADGSRFPQAFIFGRFNNLLVINTELVGKYPPLGALPSADITRAAWERDGHECIFTGQNLNLMDGPGANAMWLLPLGAEYLTVVPFVTTENYESKHDTLRSNIRKDPAKFCKSMQTVENCLVTTDEISKLLWENKLTVDVDNDYEIIYFDERTSDTPALNARITCSMGSSPLDDEFLRTHFRHSLQVNIIGGGILDDFPEGDLGRFLRQHRDDMKAAQFSGGAWDTDIGRVVYQWIMKGRVGQKKRKRMMENLL